MKLLLTALALTVGAAATASAQATASTTQTVTFTVTEVNTISVSGNPAGMTVGAGGPSNTATNSATTYAVSSNADALTPKKITAQLDSDMPTGVTLQVNLAAPGTATSGGNQTLVSTIARDVVTGISHVDSPANTITYTLTATAAASTAAADTRVVTYTIQ